MTEAISIECGVRQGCIPINGKLLNKFRYAGDANDIRRQSGRLTNTYDTYN